MSEAGGLPLGIVDGLEIDDDRVVTIAHDDPLRGLVGWIDLLVRNEGGDIDEVPGPGVRLVFQAITPTHPDMTADHIDDGLLLAVMVGSVAACGATSVIPAHIPFEPTVSPDTAVTRCIPDVCGVFGSKCSALTTRTA